MFGSCSGKLSSSPSVGDGCGQGLSEHRTISAYIVQNDKMQYVNPWRALPFSSFRVGFDHLGAHKEESGRKPAATWRVLKKKAFLTALAESMDAMPLSLQAVLTVLTEFIFLSL